MIEIKGLKKSFPGGTQAVRGVDLEVEAGELLALLGPNGAGKTTTIRACTTLSGFDDGAIRVAGHDVDREPRAVRRAIGYVAQSSGVDFFLTGRENLILQGRLHHMRRDEIAERITALARQFDLEDALDRLVSTYSGGMQRKLDIATALIHRPRVLFLDEPTLGLDTASRRTLWQLIRRLNVEEGLTILLTTHYLEEADDLARRVAIMHQGEVKVVGEPERLKADLGGDSVTVEFPPGVSAQEWLEVMTPRLGIRRQIWEGDRLHLYLPDASHAMPVIMESAREHGVEIQGISLARPTLDDVFLHYTGASLRGGEEETGEPWWKKWAGKGGGSWSKQWQGTPADAEGEGETEGPSEGDWRQWQDQAGQGEWQGGRGEKAWAEERDGERTDAPTHPGSTKGAETGWQSSEGPRQGWSQEDQDRTGGAQSGRQGWQKKGEDEA